MKGFNQGLLVLFASSLIACGGQVVEFGVATGADGGGTVTAPPAIPTTLASGVCTNKTISATFSEAMDASTINSTTFKVASGPSATPVTGTVSYDAVKKAATFIPSPDL